jgi:CcmD family protein
METMVAAYVFAWAAVTAYLAWLAVQNGHLGRRLDELERLAKRGVDEKRSSSKAA